MIGWLDENTNEISSGMAVLKKEEIKGLKIAMKKRAQ